MKTNLKQLATATLMLLAVATVQAAQYIELPDPTVASANQNGTFSIKDNTISLTGGSLNLTTSTAKGDIASGSARFMSGELQYNDGANSVDGQMGKVSFGSQVKDGQVVYILKGLVYGKLTKAGQLVDVNGNFSVITKPAAEGTSLTQAQVASASLIMTPRSNVNNNEPANTSEVKRSHAGNRSKH
jgi:hypothetical protein